MSAGAHNFDCGGLGTPNAAEPASSLVGHKQDAGGRIAPALLQFSGGHIVANRGKGRHRSQHPGGERMVCRRCGQQQRLCLGIVGLVEHGERLRTTRRLQLMCGIENRQQRCSPLFRYGGGHADRDRAGNRFRRRRGSRQQRRRRWRGGLGGDWCKCQRIVGESHIAERRGRRVLGSYHRMRRRRRQKRKIRPSDRFTSPKQEQNQQQ